MTLSLFRYSGNKSRLAHLYRAPPKGTTRIVEPFLGSGGYTINSGLPGYGVDQDLRVITLWKWLQSGPDLQPLAQRWVDIQTRWKVDGFKPDIMQLEGISEGERLYLKVNVCGAYMGQWSSKLAYPQHSLPTQRTAQAIPAASTVEVSCASYETVTTSPGDMLFVDPVYLGTEGNYQKAKGVAPEHLQDWLLGQRVPTIVTYGDGARDTYPQLKWEPVATRKVPILRGGGTRNRTEWAAYLNWPDVDARDARS